MKYFSNITTPEELKKQFRAYCVTMHPDKGGDPEEFKNMVAEYNNITRDFERAKERAQEEAEERRQAEEYAKAEAKRKAEEEEAARKAAEAMRPVIAKWSAILERVPEKQRYCKPTAAYSAAVKRNIKAVFAKYFPGVKVSVTLTNKAWSEKAQITWTDGPTVENVENVAEFRHFVSTEHVCDPYSDYGDDVEIKYNKAWREAFGEIDAQRFEFVREFSEFGKAEVLEKIREILPQFVSVDDRNGTAKVTESDTYKLVEFFGFTYKYNGMYKDLSDEEREKANRFDCDHMTHRRKCDRLASSNYYGDETPLSDVVKLFRSYYSVSASASQKAKEEAEAPKFTPVHNATYNAIVKALGGNFFAASNDGQEWSQRKPITPTEAAELLAKGVRVDLVKPWKNYDGETCISGVNAGGWKTQKKRAEKFAAVGFTAPIIGQYKNVYFTAVSAEVLAELRKDAESVEEQRKAWEAAQREDKTESKAKAEQKATKQQTNDTANDEAPAEGLQLVEIAEGVAVVGDSRTTFRNRKQIKAHGASWNNDVKQWQATDPEAVARLRQWFGASATQTAEEADTANESEQPGSSTAQTAEQEHAHTAESDRKKAFCVIFAACEIGATEWNESGYYTGGTAEEWEDLEAVAPETVTAWKEAGQPLNRNECARLYGEELTKEAADAHTVASHRAKYCEDWREELREIWAIYKDLTAIESTTADTDAHAEEQEQEQHAHNTTSEQSEPQEQPEQQSAEEVERVTRFATLLADVFTMFEELATAAQTEAQRAKETATRQAEAEQLRADIAQMSAQVAKMAETLRTMSERLATIEAEANADSHTDNSTTDTGTASDNEPQPEKEAQERPDRGKGKPDTLYMLRAAAEDVAQLTEANDHTAALLARLYVLAAVGLRVRPLILRAKAIEAAQKRGHITPDEVTDRQRISQETERRAALFLTPEEFRALYRHDPQTDSKAA